MNSIKDREQAMKVSLFLSVLGLIIPNGIFLYYFFTDYNLLRSAMSNPVSLVFIMEAFILMFYIAWLLSKFENKPFSGFIFILLSIIGSLGFSVPFMMYKSLNNKPIGS